MKVRYRKVVGRGIGRILMSAGVMGLIAGCEEPDIVPVAPPGAPLPRTSPDTEPAAAKGEMPAAISLNDSAKAEKPNDIDPAPPTAKGQTRTTKRGVTYETLKGGTGPELKFGQTGQFLYEGRLQTGRVFDSTHEDGKPREFAIGPGVIGGWQEGLPGMKVGEKRKLTIPPILGYGPNGEPRAGIPPEATLIFEVELVGIKGQ